MVGNNVEVSVRSVGLAVDVNSLCQKIFGKQYSGGKMGAGASKIPLSFCSLTNASDEVKSKMWNGIKSYIIERIFQDIM